MANLYSQYGSGAQFPAGTIAGSATGASGINPIVDRLNSISTDNGVYSNLGSGTGISISAGSVVGLSNKTSYLSLAGTAFMHYTNTDTYIRPAAAAYVQANNTIQFTATVELPHGAVVTAAIVYCNDSSESWVLYGGAINAETTGTSMASANMNTEDSSISSATIDNSTNKYWFAASNLDNGDRIRGARITYTTDYD